MRLNFPVILAIGAIIPALGGVGIFFEPREPYQLEIFFATILKGVLVSLLIGLSLAGRSSWKYGLLYGFIYGLAFGLVVFLAKGGLRSMDAPYVVPASIVTGAITGLLVAKFGFSKR